MSKKRSSKKVRGDTAELATKKGRQVFQEKNRGATPSVAAPSVSHPSDATVRKLSVVHLIEVNPLSKYAHISCVQFVLVSLNVVVNLYINYTNNDSLQALLVYTVLHTFESCTVLQSIQSC